MAVEVVPSVAVCPRPPATVGRARRRKGKARPRFLTGRRGLAGEARSKEELEPVLVETDECLAKTRPVAARRPTRPARKSPSRTGPIGENTVAVGRGVVGPPDGVRLAYGPHRLVPAGYGVDRLFSLSHYSFSFPQDVVLQV